ncbi:MAG: peptidylprolyl isomerase [Candidatus Competibacter sp.]|nr:peptidylprolyl isomerase [Candidatus Competibacter sp.]
MPITVNGVEITDSAIHAEMQHHPASSREAAEYSAKLALVAKELLLQEAARLEIAGDDEEERIAALMERELKTPEPDETSCRRFFMANRQRFRDGDLFEASHILCAAPPGDATARSEARARAESALAQLTEGGGNFAELAATLSDCPSKQNGGSLGQIGLAQTVPEFERALLDMREGEISSQPLESRFGFHVIRLHRKIEGRPLEYDTARDRIVSYLRESAQRQGISRYLSSLIGRADIAGIDLLGTNSPLAR